MAGSSAARLVYLGGRGRHADGRVVMRAADLRLAGRRPGRRRTWPARAAKAAASSTSPASRRCEMRPPAAWAGPSAPATNKISLIIMPRMADFPVRTPAGRNNGRSWGQYAGVSSPPSFLVEQGPPRAKAERGDSWLSSSTTSSSERRSRSPSPEVKKTTYEREGKDGKTVSATHSAREPGHQADEFASRRIGTRSTGTVDKWS